MPTSSANAHARLARRWRVLVGPLFAVALLGAAPAGAQAPTIVRVIDGLTFGTAMPGQTPVQVAPWTFGGTRGRSAPVFQITGAPNATVRLLINALPSTMQNGSGTTVAVTNYVVQYNTVHSASGAQTLSATIGTPILVTLSPTGVGYVSLGAMIAPPATQARGPYAFGAGGSITVLP
jgi:hypothetical protein